MTATRRPFRWRIGDAVDEWAHRCGFGRINCYTPGWWRFTPFVWLCDRRELSYGVPWGVMYPTTSTTANTSVFTITGKWQHHDGNRRKS